MRYPVIATVLLVAAACNNPVAPGGGGGGGGYTDFHTKRLVWNVTVVSSADHHAVAGAKLSLVYRDDYADTADRTLSTDVTDQTGYGMVGFEIGHGNYISSCQEGTAWNTVYLDVEAEGFQPLSQMLDEAGCWFLTAEITVPLDPL